ncbi:tetratricopeptide repeat protein [Haliangium sp.]|uniref:tetratricopeptide repeat protein n=1 Tax=Haliangium sp. TaxID=2663208 RepID=UPI003D0ED697
MYPMDSGKVSFSLLKLRSLARSFDQVDSGHEVALEQMLRLAESLGATAAPLCMRELSASSERRARWACALLTHLASLPEGRDRAVGLRDALSGLREDSGDLRQRIIAALRELCEVGGAVDELGRSRARRLLTALGVGEQPLDDDGLIADFAGLVRAVRTPDEIALAADRLVIELEPDDLLALVEDFAEEQPERALWLVDELLLRTDLDQHTRAALRRVAAPLGNGRGRTGPPGRPARTDAAALDVWVGEHDSGRAVVIVARSAEPGAGGARRSRGARRLRIVCMLLAADGTLIDGLYGADFTAHRLDTELLTPLRQRGYRFAAAPLSRARQVVRAAAYGAVCRGRLLPQAYYLGRDLLGLYDEHHASSRRSPDHTPLLERGLEILRGGDLTQARDLIERYLERAPHNAEGRAAMGRCLLAQGRVEEARGHLLQAIALDPENPLHHWNLAAVAHRQGRSGGCYLALQDYLDLAGEGGFDAGAGASDERYDIACGFVAEYERLARIEYPQVAPTAVARADDLVHKARVRLDGGHHEPAVALLEQALATVPEHYPAWTRLGTAWARLGRADAAMRCLRKALTLKPGDPEALAALAGVELGEGLGSAAPSPRPGYAEPRAGRLVEDRHPQG